MLIRHRVSDRRTQANTVRDAEIAAGFQWGGSVFQVDPGSRSAISARALRVSRTGEGVAWRTADNADHLFSAEEFLEFADGVDAFIEFVMQKCWQVKGLAV